MKYKIERAIAGDGDNGWVRSDTYPDTYTGEDAGRILKSSSLNYRMVAFPKPTPEPTPKPTRGMLRGILKPSKPYRRHAAITPLELRGAIAMLESAAKYTYNRVPCKDDAEREQYTATCVILWDARIAVQRALEALERGE